MVANLETETPLACRVGDRIINTFSVLSLLLPNALFHVGAMLNGQPVLLRYSPAFSYVMNHAERVSGIEALAELVLAGYTIIAALTFTLYRKEIAASITYNQRRSGKEVGLNSVARKHLGLALFMSAAALLIPPVFHQDRAGHPMIILLVCLFASIMALATALACWLVYTKEKYLAC